MAEIKVSKDAVEIPLITFIGMAQSIVSALDPKEFMNPENPYVVRISTAGLLEIGFPSDEWRIPMRS